MEYEDYDYEGGELVVSDSDKTKFAKIAEMSYSGNDDAVINEYNLTVDEKLSDNEGLVLIDNSTGNVIISIRGSTVASDFLVSDLAILFGQLKLTPRYRREKARLIRVKEKYPRRLIDLTGHSLGASLCVALTYELPDFINRAIVFNPGFSYSDVKKSIINKLKSKLIPSFLKSKEVKAYENKIKCYRIKNDLVSLLSKVDSNTETIDNNKSVVGAHSLENFT